MKIYILLADGFEECEALVPADLLMRAGAQVVLTIDNRVAFRTRLSRDKSDLRHGHKRVFDKRCGNDSAPRRRRGNRKPAPAR